MKVVSLDVHGESSQLSLVSSEGEVLMELVVATEPEELRRVVKGIPGPKRVVFEEGPMSAMIHDALEGVADEIVSCDGSQNALIARSEDSSDERDARRLAMLDGAGALRGVYTAPEPYRTLRSVLGHDRSLAEQMTGVKNRIKALRRRHGIRCRGVTVYGKEGRKAALSRIESSAIRWQLESAYRQLDGLSRERVGAHRVLGRVSRGVEEISRLRTIPWVGTQTARTLSAWIVAPRRFRSGKAVSSYGG